MKAPVAHPFEVRRTELPVHALLAGRYSPRAFSEAPVTEEELTLLEEAARLSPSGSNEQPWRFLTAHRGEERFGRIVDALLPNNRSWAAEAPLLLVAAVLRFNSRTGNPNAYGRYDLGLAMGALTVQATAMELGVHQMGGFDAARLRTNLAVDEALDLVVVVAIGRPGSADRLPDGFRERELVRTARKPLDELLIKD